MEANKDDEEKGMLSDSEDQEVEEQHSASEKYEGAQIIWDLDKLIHENKGRVAKN